jgi:allene oxide cyclase
MSKKVFVIALVLAVVLTASLSLVLSTGSARQSTTIHVIEHVDTDLVTDTGAEGDSLGDILTFANPIYDEADAEQVGTDQGFCVRVVVGEAWECMWTTFLADGQITVEGPFYDTKESTFAITGGTGAYQNARGQMQLKFNAAGATRLDFIFEIYDEGM